MDERQGEDQGAKGPPGEPSGNDRPWLAERLLAARKRRRIRQRDAAREIGVCRATINRIEGGRRAAAGTRDKLRWWLEAES